MFGWLPAETKASEAWVCVLVQLTRRPDGHTDAATRWWSNKDNKEFHSSVRGGASCNPVRGEKTCHKKERLK